MRIISTGDCQYKASGIRFGKTSVKYVQLQVHWTNEGKSDAFYDSSGIKIHYTPNLRKYDEGVLTVGQMLLELPPGKKEVIMCFRGAGKATRALLNGRC